jgi:hypothetical protein
VASPLERVDSVIADPAIGTVTTRPRAGWLTTLLWIVLLGALIVLPSLFAIQQYRWTGGYLFYANAFDEPTYLSYDGALIAASPTYGAEYLVLGLHRAGLSGGFINLLFDVVFPAITVVFLRRFALEAGFSPLEATAYPFAVVAIPVLFGYTNPYYGTVYNANYYSRGLSWITLPQAYYPPFLRSPEPQVSWCAIAVAGWLGLRWRSYLIALAVAPFVYPFVGVPYTFVVLALWIYARAAIAIQQPTMRAITAMAASFMCIAAVLRIGFVLVVAGRPVADFVLATRMPLVSGTGVVALVVYLAVRSRLDETHRVPALFLAVAPLVAVNTQVLTGFIAQPSNFEQNFGVAALAIIIVLALRTIEYGRVVVVCASAVASCVLLGAYAGHIFLVNSSPWQRERLSDAFLNAMRTEPESLIIGDPDLADLFSLALPALHFSALARSQILPEPGGAGREAGARRFDNYLCVKQLLKRPEGAAAVDPAVFASMDRQFRYLNQDFPLLHLNRHRHFRQYFDPSKEPARCAARQLKVFPAVALSAPLGRVDLPAEITTLPQQWAYAAQVALAAQTSADKPTSDRINVRVTLAVTGGCVGAGVLAPDQRTFVSHKEMDAAAGTQTADLIFRETDEPHWLVLRNCSATGASTAVVHPTEVFRVEGVTVRTFTAVPSPAAERR